MYHVRYVLDAVAKIRSFKSKLDTYKFISNFLLTHQFDEGSWIESVVFGELLYIESSVKVVENV